MKTAYVFLAVLCAALAGCASVPKVADPSGVDLSIHSVSESEATLRFGANESDGNPYLTPGGILQINKDQYVLVELKINADKPAHLEIYSIVARDAEGKEIAHFFEWNDFVAYIDDWKIDSRSGDMQRAAASRNYLKSTSLDLKPGSRSYMAVLIGKKPMPKKFTIDALFGVGDASRKVTIEGKI
jgi:hypothetical protein